MGADKLVVVGQGYVGLPIAMRAVDAGFDVVGLETNAARVDMLSSGRSFVEDISDPQVRAALKTGRYVATSEASAMQDFDFVIITVPTPLKAAVPDLSFITDAAAVIGPHLSRGATVVLESTTYPGTTEELLVPALESSSAMKAGVDFFVGYSPERIDPGNATYNFVNTPKVFAGINDSSTNRLRALYERLVDNVVEVSGPKEAELTKLLENTFRHVNIALVNELSMFAHALDIDIWETIEAASTKPFGFMRFTPGPGVGGHCLPVDPTYLSWQVRQQLGRNFRFVELANDVNDHMPEYVIQRIMHGLNERSEAIRGSVVLVVGLSYKKNSGDMRQSPAIEVVNLLNAVGADVQAVDNFVDPGGVPEFVRLVEFTPEVVADADAVVILTDHDDLDYGVIVDAPGYVFDARHRLSGVRESL